MVRRYRRSRRGQTTDHHAGYRPNEALAIAAAVIYGVTGTALFIRVIRSRAWWALCLPIGSSCKAISAHCSPPYIDRASFCSRSTWLLPSIRIQIQPQQSHSLRLGGAFYHLLASHVSRIQLHHLWTFHLAHRHRTFDRKPPKGSEDIRHQRYLHLLVTGSCRPSVAALRTVGDSETYPLKGWRKRSPNEC